MAQSPEFDASVSEIPSAVELAALHDALRAIYPLPEADLARFPLPRRRRLARGQYFLRAGERASEVAMVLSGALREYFLLADGSERTRNFNLAGELAGSLSDLLGAEPARTTVRAEADTVLLVTRWRDYQALTASSLGWERFARALAERLYGLKVHREYELLALDAGARYRLAKARWPLLETQFSQRDIASYIGVTPVHLSRLRRAAAAQKKIRTNPSLTD